MRVDEHRRKLVEPLSTQYQFWDIFWIFFWKLITGNEICFYLYDPETKGERMARHFITKTQEGSHG